MIKNTKFFRFVFLDFILSRKANGFTILLSVLVASIVLSVGMGIFGVMTRELKLSGMGRESQIAFSAADAGIECFFYWEIKHPDLADTAFGYYDSDSPAVKCAGNNTAMPVKSNGPYDLTLNLGNNSCAKINIIKDTLLSNKIITTVTSKGYNTACDSTSPFKVERAIQLVSTKQQGGGSYIPPDAPENLNIARVWASKMRLTWTNSCGGDSSCSYSLYRSTDGNTFSLAKSGITSSQNEDTGLLPTTLYYYYVTAVNSYGESSESNTENDTTSAYTASKTFDYTGGQQTWLVLTDVTSISIKASGAQGNGLGGESSAIVAVTPGETLYVYAGGQPSGRMGGWNGGGNGGSTSWGAYGTGGGGASDVRRGGTALANRIIVAGGGGGRGSNDAGGSRAGGSGGSAGNTAGASGGSGQNDAPVSGGGGGGTQTSAGSAGTAGGGNGGAPGNAGTAGNGGAGAIGPSGASGGGGGGGGYFGGGGGGSNYQSAGGGGGGSGYVTGYDTSMASGVISGNGQVIIEW